MRIAQLNLKAYGHFTDDVLRFPAAPDMHLLYGPNEAGKTTISRALKAALFGVPARTDDNFKHPYPSLRVGLVLESPTETLAAMRRKGNKNSLTEFDPATGEEAGKVIADEVLPAWLGGLSEGLYTSMFSLDHQRLVEGGESLSKGEGEIGQSLFAAGAGLASIRELRDRFDTEANQIFKAQARTLPVNQTLGDYADARKAARDALTRPAQWESLRKAVDVATREYESARKTQDDLQLELRRLERLAAVLPDIASLQLVRDHLVDLQDVKRLEPDARNRRLAAETRLQQANSVLATVDADLERFEAKRAGLSLAPDVLLEGGAIEAVHGGLGQYRDAREKLLAAKGRLDLARQQVRDLGRQVHIEGDVLRSQIPDAILRARVQGLQKEGESIRRLVNTATETSDSQGRELAEINRDLETLGVTDVPDSLLAVLKEFDAEGNPEKQLLEATQQYSVLKARLEAESKALRVAGLDDLVRVTPPALDEVQGHIDRAAEITTRRRAVEEQAQGIEDDLASVMGEMAGLLQQGEVPTAEHLASQRGQRDALWGKIRRLAYPDEQEMPEPAPTATEYEQAVQVADGTADARFTDAARVTQHADLVKRQLQMQNAIQLARDRLAQIDREKVEQEQSWADLVEKHELPVQTMTGASEWITGRAQVLRRHPDLLELETRLEAAKVRAADVGTRLGTALAEAGLPPYAKDEPIAQAITRARSYVEAASNDDTSRRHLERRKADTVKRVDTGVSKLREAETELAAWQQRWDKAMAAIGLDAGALDIEANARIDQLIQLEAALDAVDESTSELEAARVTVTRMDEETARLCQAVGMPTSGLPTDALIETFHERLKEARAQELVSRSLADRIASMQATREKNQQVVNEAQAELAALMAAADCSDTASLTEAEERSARLTGYETEQRTIEVRLVAASALTLPDLLAQAAGQDLVQVKAALDRAGDELKLAMAKVQTQHATLIAAQTDLDRVDGSGLAGVAEQQASEAAARLGTLLADYASTRLATTILSKVIETYQERHQGPVLARASTLFAQITGGKFTGVSTDMEEDKTVLVALRANGRRESVAALSSGRRDQLFLALRLAAIEGHIDSQGPIPIVVDDIVINFDDDAVKGTFSVLSELAQKTQVLFFTHHVHLIGVASSVLGNHGFHGHHLEAFT